VRNDVAARGVVAVCIRIRRNVTMAELDTLEEKLAEVLGLAQAAQEATERSRG
jgi:hypothetical protein